MEKHISKKLFMSALALSAGFALASCDPVTTIPSNYNDPILVDANENAIDFDDNILGTLYDSIASDKNSKVVDKILREVVEEKFGTYKDFIEMVNGTSTNLLSKDYFVYKNADDKKNNVKIDDDTRTHMFEQFKIDVFARISEYFYNEITSGSYNDETGKFDEQKLYDAHRQELYDLEKTTIDNKFYVTKDLKKDDVFKADGTSILVGTYSNFEDGKRGYIEEKVYPEILKNKLVEDYIFRNNASSLGRSYARKINFIKVTYEEDFSKLWAMLKNFSDTYIKDSSKTADFEVITNAVKGFTTFDGKIDVITNKGDEKAQKADDLASSVFTEIINVPSDYEYQDKVIIPHGDYYTDSKIGQIIESFQKAQKAEDDGRFPTADDKAELDKFTADGKSKEYGLLQKVISLAKEDYTTDGWFVKSSGAGDLTSKISDRLFNIKVANDIDKDSVDEKSYLRAVGDKKLVLPNDSQPEEENDYNYICQDISGKAFYICEVTEAVSPAKLNEKSNYYYGKSENNQGNPYRVEDISRSVAKILGTKDSYIKDAYTACIDQYKDIIFYDTSLYEYLKSEYPDLEIFDDED